MSQSSHKNRFSSLYWTDRDAERRSGHYAAATTFGLVLALNVALLLPIFPKTIAVPLGDEPLSMEIRRVAPPPPPMEEPVVEQTRKLVSEVPAPEAVVIPEPPKEIPKPTPPKPVRQRPRPQPQPRPVPADPAPSVSDAPTAPARAGHSSGEAVAKPDPSGEILAALLRAVERNKKYPRQARRTGKQGTVTLRVTVGDNGKVTSAVLVKGSGVTMLDEATKDLGKSLMDLDIPQARGRGLTVNIPVKYELKG